MIEVDDSRVIRTKKSLREALLKLMSKHNLDDVRVKNICTLAGVNRGTFYKHYDDKYALFDDYLSKLVSEVESIGGKCLRYDSENDIHTTLIDLYMLFSVQIMKYFVKNSDILKGVVVNNKESLANFMFTNRMEKAYNDFLNRMRPVVKFEIPADVISMFCISGLIHLVMYWLETGQIKDIEKNTISIRTILQHNLYIQK
ncbi:MAG: hypothetical protein BKP49_05050 [Treponema sp. CETP13]|nr:MAG: hypothetical protein BKP49_05050 [Treponema sp. CETP13]